MNTQRPSIAGNCRIRSSRRTPVPLGDYSGATIARFSRRSSISRRRCVALFAAAAITAAAAAAQTADAAERLLAGGRLDEARTAYKALIAQEPLTPEHHVGLARVMMASGQAQGVMTLLMPTAVRWMEMGRYREAAALLEVTVEAVPDSTRAWSLLGRAHALGRQYRAAEESLQTAVDRGDRNLMTLLLLGSTLWENGSVEAAEKLFVEALDVPRGDTMLAVHQLASMYLWQGRYAEAIEGLDRVVRSRPTWIGAQVDLARALQGAGRFEESRRFFEIYLSRVPDDPKARYGLATVLARLGERELAAEQMTISAELREQNRLMTLEEGRLQAELDQATFLLGQERAAEAEAVLEPLPRTIDVLALLSRARRAQGDLDGAVLAMEEAVAQDPSRVDLRGALQALYAAKEPE